MSDENDGARCSSELLDSRAAESPASEPLNAARGTDDVFVTTTQPSSVTSTTQTTPRQ